MKKFPLFCICGALLLSCVGCAEKEVPASAGTVSETAQAAAETEERTTEKETEGTTAEKKTKETTAEKETVTPVTTAAAVTTEAETAVTEAGTTEALEEAIFDPENPVTLLYDIDLSEGHSEDYRWQVPLFNCRAPGAEELNEKIRADYAQLVEDSVKEVEEQHGTWCRSITYRVHLCEPFCTLEIISGYDWDCGTQVYVLNCLTGDEADNRDILNHYGISMDEFLENARKSALACFDETVGDITDADLGMMEGFVESQRNVGLSEEFINEDMKLYAEEGDQLMLISNIGCLAGPEYMETTYPYIGRES